MSLRWLPEVVAMLLGTKSKVSRSLDALGVEQSDTDGDAAVEIQFDERGQLAGSPGHLNYRWRGEELERLALLEYGPLVVVLPVSSNDAWSGMGRPRNKSFAFADEHPLSSGYEQHLRSQPWLPILGGRSCPPVPRVELIGC